MDLARGLRQAADFSCGLASKHKRWVWNSSFIITAMNSAIDGSNGFTYLMQHTDPALVKLELDPTG